ncbi:MAG: uroporphyrinogen-III synthase [Alphaproteobacteria bacterium]|nr:uroporphyrinogen-III synthase [Alphaproteobacteria bacterium]
MTRPREDAERTAAILRACGHEAVISPLTDIRFLEGPEIPLEGMQAILATSANGIRGLARRTVQRHLPVFTVGTQTLAIARAAGFSNTKSADGDAHHLAEYSLERLHPEDGGLLHVAGRQHNAGLMLELSQHGFTTRTEIVYEAFPVEGFSEDALATFRSKRMDAVLLFSRRGACLFAAQIRQAELSNAISGVRAVCISQAAAEPVRALGLAQIRVASAPHYAAMLELLS